MKKIITLLMICYCFSMNAQTPLTDATFAQAITDILAQDPNGDYNLAPFGKIQDWDVSQVTAGSFLAAVLTFDACLAPTLKSTNLLVCQCTENLSVHTHTHTHTHTHPHIHLEVDELKTWS